MAEVRDWAVTLRLTERGYSADDVAAKLMEAYRGNPGFLILRVETATPPGASSTGGDGPSRPAAGESAGS